MYLRSISIHNFRALKNIEVDFTPGVNVIVGPNAIGKTTVLEAMRLAKAMLAPRTQSESNQALQSLGAASPHLPNQIIGEALVQTAGEPLVIKCLFQLSEKEIGTLIEAEPQLTTQLVRARIGNAVAPSSFTAFLSSPGGTQAIAQAKVEIDEGMSRLRNAAGCCRLELNLDVRGGRATTPDPMGAAFVAYLDQSLPADRTKFSYFPADRALPRGEQPIQLGSQEANQQLEAHNSQPQLKYARLKNTIFSTIVSKEDGRVTLAKDFETIFSGVLRGKQLVGSSVNHHGLLTTSVRDIESGRTFDIDAMSSGEKGLILTFLLISRSISEGGVVLLDEPELHLNPAVCKELLPFLVENYVAPRDLQMIVCSHSPEVLASAFNTEHCALYHLISESMLTRVRQSDEILVGNALRLLGTSESEGLLYKGTIFVEGDDDVELIEHGFGFLLRQYKLKDLGGRREVEKQIRALQAAEKNGGTLSKRYFIFDHDGSPTNLTNSSAIKVLQWGRRCLENYLLEIDILCDMLMNPEINKTPVRAPSEVTNTLKNLAMKHLDDEILRQVYDEFAFESPGRRSSEVAGLAFDDAADKLFDRLDRIKGQMAGLSRTQWKADIVRKCQMKRADLEALWDTKWPELCDGKRLFSEIQKTWTLTSSILNFKKKIVDKMRATPPSENWRTVERLISELIAG